MRFNSPRQFCMNLWSIAVTLHSPKGIRSHSKNSKLSTVKAVYCLDASSILICQNPDFRCRQEKWPAPTRLSNASWILSKGEESFFVWVLRWQKSIQKHRHPSFFLTRTTALHHALWMGHMAPKSSISHRWLWTSSTKGWGIHWNCSLNGASSIIFIMCSVEWVQPSLPDSSKKTSWYLTRNDLAESAKSGGHDSKPLKCSSSSNFPCPCHMVNLGDWGVWGSSSPFNNWVIASDPDTAVATTAQATRVFFLRVWG